MAAATHTPATGTRGLAVVLVDDTFEDLEFHYPRLRLREAGFDVQTAAVAVKHDYKSKHGYWGAATLTFDQVDPATVKCLVIPGGMCTDRLRRSS
jgi:deglycase